MVEEILALGFDRIELGYDLTLDLVPGVQAQVEQKAVSVTSVHNFCPVPVGAPYGHPELYHLTSLEHRGRQTAVTQTLKTVHFAAEMGAPVVITHSGNVIMKNYTRRLIAMHEDGKNFGRRYEKLKLKQLMKRDKKAPRHIERLIASLGEMLPELESLDIQLAIENLPSWESVPTETEFERILDHFQSPNIRYWHDIGHGQVRQNLGFTSHVRWLEKLRPHLAGMHVHDVTPPAMDHVMPPNGAVDFSAFRETVQADIPLVIEPPSGVPSEQLVDAVQFLCETWELNQR